MSIGQAIAPVRHVNNDFSSFLISQKICFVFFSFVLKFLLEEEKEKENNTQFDRISPDVDVELTVLMFERFDLKK